MGKSFNNPFAANPEMKFGLSPDTGIIRPQVRMQEDRRGVVRVPQRPAYPGVQRPQQVPVPRNDSSRGYRVQAPTSRAPAGADRPAMVPTVSPRSNMPQPAAGNTPPQAAGHGKPVSNQAPPSGSSTKGRGQAKTQAVVKEAGGGIVGGLRLDFSGDNLMRGFIMSELLGRPKSMRRGRW